MKNKMGLENMKEKYGLSPIITIIFLCCLFSNFSFALDQEKNQQYKLLMSKDKRMCSHMLEIFNQDLKKYGRNGDYHQRESEEFQSIPWTPIEGQEKVEFGEPAFKSALIDLNNDGTEDYVMRYASCCFRHRLISSVYMLDKSAQNLSYKELAKLTGDDAKHKISFIGNSYKLRLNNAHISPEIVEIFKYGGIHYIAMHESLEISRPSYGYAVIASYTGGNITLDNQTGMEDICYFKRIKTKK